MYNTQFDYNSTFKLPGSMKPNPATPNSCLLGAISSFVFVTVIPL